MSPSFQEDAMALDVPRDAPSESSPDSKSRQSSASIIVPYLLEQSPEFQVLGDLREKGWNNRAGDAFFKKQRKVADEADGKAAFYLYKMMKNIGEELHANTAAFNIAPKPDRAAGQILDMCMAPGGFLDTAMRKNPFSRALAFTLPVVQGGHKVLLSRRNVNVRFLDINMLAEDMGTSLASIPEDHPDAGNFKARQFDADQKFDLVLCDGQVLRTHQRATYREHREARRLTLTQLALGLEHVNVGGTMVVLLHKLELWVTSNLIWMFQKFSDVTLYKPQRHHTKRSSFYMVARDIQSNHPKALDAIASWKEIWRVATFGSEEEIQMMIDDRNAPVQQMMDEFGPTLVDMGREIWKTQADALAEAPFIKNMAEPAQSGRK